MHSRQRLLCAPVVFFLIVLFSSCAPRLTPHRTADPSDATFDWGRTGPLAFLEFLRAKHAEPCPSFMVHGVPDHWLSEAAIPELMVLLDSEEPCANVYSLYSSFRDCRASTLGHEAAFLIEGFRKGAYPPALNSGRSEVNKDALKRWWDTYAAGEETL